MQFIKNRIIPKLENLWYFWDGPPMSSLLKLCVKSLLLHSSGFNVYQLNSSNIREFLPNLTQKWNTIKLWAHKVDYLKPRILYNYGGIFADVDTICLNDLWQLTDLLKNSRFTLMGDGWGDKTVAISFLVAKPKSNVLKCYINNQDSYLKKNNFKVKNWHDIGTSSLRSCINNNVYFIRDQRPSSVARLRGNYFSNKKWTQFVHSKFRIPVLWPIMHSGRFYRRGEVSKFTEEQWLNGSWMISDALRYALRLDKLHL